MTCDRYPSVTQRAASVRSTATRWTHRPEVTIMGRAQNDDPERRPPTMPGPTHTGIARLTPAWVQRPSQDRPNAAPERRWARPKRPLRTNQACSCVCNDTRLKLCGIAFEGKEPDAAFVEATPTRGDGSPQTR
jgi:hypothetical protein